MNAALRRLLVPLLRAVKDGKPVSFRMKSAAQQALYLVGKPSPSRKKPARERKEKKRAAHREDTGALRAAVFARAGGWCEVRELSRVGLGELGSVTITERCALAPTEMDHWLGGWGRRRQKQSIETCWALCTEHHRLRQANYPSAAAWNLRFQKHCRAHGYPFTPHIEHAALPGRAEPRAAAPNAMNSED